ncbi:hypothetical protein HAX54_001316 [Datura stramonium]|uniref:Uncharacterized protein n=1 Tax=Datura stramonium TaxID=4076 RepID=A0ABS8RSP3_DATST|nr:hypothetical protein [Datura stramonium]
MAERDAACIRERNMALEEKEGFCRARHGNTSERCSTCRRNALIQERDDAIAALRLQDSSTNDNNTVPDSPGNGTESATKHIYNQQQMHRTIAEAAHGSMEDPAAGYLKNTDTSEAKIPKRSGYLKRADTISQPSESAKVPVPVCSCWDSTAML